MKPPAFQLYCDDFLAGTYDLSQEEVGAYIRLLCHQWNRGSIPVQPDKQQRLAGGPVSQEVLAKFPVWDDGQLRNLRLEEERRKYEEYVGKQREKGRKSGLVRRTAAEQRFNHGSTAGATGAEPEGEPEANRTRTLQSPTPIINTPYSPPAGGRDSGDAGRVADAAEKLETFRLRVGGWFKRRPSTKWTAKETKALRDVHALGTPEDDLAALEAYYLSGYQFLRRDPLTLLNNWNGEIDRAKSWKAAPPLPLTAGGPINGHTVNPQTELINVEKAIRALEDRIATHPANPEARNAPNWDEVTDDQRAELTGIRNRATSLKERREQMLMRLTGAES